MMLDLIARHWEMLDALLAVIGLVIYVVASHSLHQRRHPSAAIAWVMAILLVPYVALPLYLAFGSRKIVPRQPAVGALKPTLADVTTHATAARVQQLAQAMGLPEPVAYESLVIHADGHESLEALRRLVDGATRTLEISTFLFGRDVLGNEIGARLQQKARDGVKVRLLIDGIGIYMGGYPDLAAFEAAGVEVLRFVSPFRSPQRGRTNLRNHRKMVIADGHCLWCGGRNLAAEYFEGDPLALIPRKPWVDLSFDLCGGMAAHAQRQFDQDWAFAGQGVVPDDPAPAPASAAVSAGCAQLVVSGPDIVDDTIYTLLVSACFTSQRRILAITPYFVPDPTLLTAMTLAARRGVDVDLVLPARSNHRLADFARHRALRELATAGGRIWLHPEMIHAKTIVVDDELAMAGSANLDGRSLFINYEMMVAFYDRGAVDGFAQWAELRRQECGRYSAQPPGMVRELAEGLLLWLAFQL